jgi:hypothetical protein
MVWNGVRHGDALRWLARLQAVTNVKPYGWNA